MIPFIYVLDLSPQFIYAGSIIGCIFNLFYYDSHNHVNRYIVSLPVNRSHIVRGRYTFLLTVSGTLLIYLWVIDMLANHFLPLINNWIFFETSYPPITPIVIMITFIAVIIIIGVSVPIYYFFQSFIKSLFAQGILLFTVVLGIAIFGNYISESIVLAVLDIIDTQPVLIPMTLTFTCLYMSYKLSETIFTKRDII